MHADLEARIHRALRALPAPQAPPRLAPRVMRAVEARLSAGWRVVGLAGALAAGVLLVVLAPWVAVLAGRGEMVARAASLLAGLERVAGAAVLVWDLAEPVAGYAAALVFVMGAVAAACGVALGRVTLGTEG